MNAYISQLTLNCAPALAPLSKAEERRAIKAAMEYFLSHRDYADDRFRVLGAELTIDKPRRRGAPPQRLVEVIIADYSARRNLGFVVNTDGKVLRGEPLAYQPAFHADEMREARAIAEQDERVARIAKLKSVFVSAYSPEAKVKEGTRLVGLRYVPSVGKQAFVPLASVAVNLNERRIVFTQPEQGHNAQGGK